MSTLDTRRNRRKSNEAARNAAIQAVLKFMKEDVSLARMDALIRRSCSRAQCRRNGLIAADRLLCALEREDANVVKGASNDDWTMTDANIPYSIVSSNATRACVLLRILPALKNGYYQDGIDACGRRFLEGVRMAFSRLYHKLGKELERSCCIGDVGLQLALVNAFGIKIRSSDHQMLAEVQIFDCLQRILGSCRTIETLSSKPSLAGTYNVPSHTANQMVNLARLQSYAAIKLVYLLTSQIAGISIHDSMKIAKVSSQKGVQVSSD